MMIQKPDIPFEIYSRLERNSTSYPDTSTISGLHGNAGAGILVLSADLQEVLLVKRSPMITDQGDWATPGGARKQMKEGGLENALTAAVAEFRKEMGSLPRGKIWGRSYIYLEPGTEFTYHTFILQLEEGEKERFIPKLDWEHTEYRWIPRESTEGIQVHRGVRKVLEDYDFNLKKPKI